MMLRTAISATVELVQTEGWSYATCLRCDSRLHGPLGRALPSKELSQFLTLHTHAESQPLAVDDVTTDVAKLRRHLSPEPDDWSEAGKPTFAKGTNDDA